MIRYRVITVPSGKAHSGWRDTKAEAEEDAIRLKMAERDESNPSKVLLDPLVRIEEQRYLPNEEIWACALEVHRQHGDDANAFCTNRIEELIDQLDLDGVAIWAEIQNCVQKLMDGGSQLQ